MSKQIGSNAARAGRSRARISAREGGLRCRAESVGLGRCLATFIREEDEADLWQRVAAADRALHEERAHFFCYWTPPAAPYRRGVLRFGRGR